MAVIRDYMNGACRIIVRDDCIRPPEEVKKIVFFKFGNIHLQKFFLNSLFGMVPVGGLFREKEGFCLENWLF